MKCYISKNYRHITNAGDKAKTDIEKVMDGLGYVNIGLQQSRTRNSIKAYFITLASLLRGVSRLRRGDTLVVQYPLKKYYDFVVSQALRRGACVVTVIHDLGSFRRKKLTIKEEIGRLQRSSVIVVHSEAMLEWLRDHGETAPMVVLGLFDYLSDTKATKPPVPWTGKPRLMFAGSLSPANNGWIYKLAEACPDVELILYGGDFDTERSRTNLDVKGFVNSDTLIATAEGEYGCVWYGDSLDEGAGSLGEYLRYNAPHKTSLYLRCGLPVIIWEKAALAEVVKRLGVGICVSSLRDIDRVLDAVTPERYALMRENVAIVSAKLSKGDFITAALAEAEKILASAPQTR